MAYLRRALGEERDRIKTIPGRGYMFIADTQSEAQVASAEHSLTTIEPLPADTANRDKLALIAFSGDLESRDALLEWLVTRGAHACAWIIGPRELDAPMPKRI